LRSENAGFPDIASSHCEKDVGYPLPGIQRMKQDGWGRRRHKRSRSFCRLFGRDAHKSFRKNSNSPVFEIAPRLHLAITIVGYWPNFIIREGLSPTPLRHSAMDLSFPIPVIGKVALSTFCGQSEHSKIRQSTL
jgi:hypothetical protein